LFIVYINDLIRIVIFEELIMILGLMSGLKNHIEEPSSSLSEPLCNRCKLWPKTMSGASNMSDTNERVADVICCCWWAVVVAVALAVAVAVAQCCWR